MARLSTGDRIGGRYRLEREIGRGGMGSVWEAEDEKLRRSVAVKVLLPSVGDDSAVERFEREAMAVARLRSPHIVQVHDYGAEGRRPFMVMELLDGQSLAAATRGALPMPLERVARLVRQAARALETAHDQGIVHRDLKPQNIFLVRDRDEELVKVFDFGIAKAMTFAGALNKLTAPGEILGTPRYMAPEQISGGDVDHRADLWALGVIAYRLLTCSPPFDGAGAGEVIIAIMSTDPRPVSSVRPNLPGGIDSFFERALAKSPEQRFQTARELADTLCDLADVSRSSSMKLPAAALTGGPADVDRPGQAAPGPGAVAEPTVDTAATTLAYSPAGAPPIIAAERASNSQAEISPPSQGHAQTPGRRPLVSLGLVAAISASLTLGGLAAFALHYRAEPSPEATSTSEPTPSDQRPEEADDEAAEELASRDRTAGAGGASTPDPTATSSMLTTGPPILDTAAAQTPPGATKSPTPIRPGGAARPPTTSGQPKSTHGKDLFGTPF